MTLDNIFSQLEGISRKLDNRDGKIESIKSAFDKELGIGKEEHDKVVSLIEQFEESEESMGQYDKEIKATEASLKSLDKAIQDLRDELSKTKLSKKERTQKQGELDDKLTERNRLTEKKDRLDTNYRQEERRNNKLKAKLSSRGISDTAKAIAANKKMESATISASKGGGMTKALGGMKGNIYMAVADFLIKAIEFGIGKATEYAKVESESIIRALNATTSVTLNRMKAGIDSWQDSVNGAYSAQTLAIQSQMDVIKAANETELANLKLANSWTNWIPIWGQMNKAVEQSTELQQQLALIQLENSQKQIQQFGEYVKLTDDYIKKQDVAIHKYLALNGLTVAQTQIFEKRMLANGEAFAKFNKTIEDALKIQNSFTEQSGRAVNYSNSDYRQSFAVGRLVGEDNLTQFQAMMNIFNSSISGSTDIMYDMYNYANKMGLSQQRLTKNVLSNLKLASKYDFKNGSRGFIELAKWAENARMSLSSFAGAIEKVQSGGLEGVIKQGAGLQVLGGNIAMGADPIAMMFEAGADQQSYAKRIQGMLRGYGSFNKATGETTFSWNENMMMRAMAEQLNMPVEELKDMARGARQKEYVKAQMGGSTLSKDNQDAVANKAQYDQETKRWYVNTISGGRMDVSEVTNENISQIVSNNKEENAEKYAQNTLSAVEKIEATTKTIAAKLGATTFDDFMKTTEAANQQTLSAFSDNLNTIASGIAEYRQNALNNQKEMLSKLGTIDTDLINAFNTVSQFKAESERKQKELEETVEKFKEQKRTTKSEQEEYIEKYKNASNPISRAWYAGRIKEGTELMKSGMKRDSFGGLGAGWSGIKTFFGNLFGEDRGNEYIRESNDVARGVQDGIMYSQNQPMAVSAASVTPIHDGTARIAKTDPKDTAIFAKAGGPFDKLFNDIFGRIDDVYHFLGGNASTSTRYGDTYTRNDAITHFLGGNASTSTRYGDTYTRNDAITHFLGGNASTSTRYGDTIQNSNTISKLWATALKGEDPILKMYEAFSPVQNQSVRGDRKLLVKALADIQGVSDKDMMSMVEPLPMKDASPDIKEQWTNALHDSGTSMTSQSTFDSPIDVNVHGDITLKSENGQSFDISRVIENDPLLIRTISQLITKHMSSALNGGRGII